jgi:hypothetical protein
VQVTGASGYPPVRLMCANQPSGVRKTLNKLKEWGWILAIPALLISFASLLVAISSLHIAGRSTVPLVAAKGTRIKATPDPNTYTLEVYFQNDGKQDATAVTLKAGTTDLSTKQTKLLDSRDFARLQAGLWESTTARLNIRRAELQKFIVICISYSDDHADTLAPAVTFYSVPDNPPLLGGSDVVPVSVPAEERETLLSWFSCAKMGK